MTLSLRMFVTKHDHGYAPFVVVKRTSFIYLTYVTQRAHVPPMKQELLPFRSIWVHPWFFLGFMLFNLFVSLYCFVGNRLYFRIYFFWPLYWLSSFDLSLLITHLVSSNYWIIIS